MNSTISNFKILDNAKVAYNISLTELKKNCIDDIHKPIGSTDYIEYLKEIENKKLDFNATQNYYLTRVEEIDKQLEKYELKKKASR